MPGHHHECHVGSIGHARKLKGQTNAPQSPAKAQSEHVQPHAVGRCGVCVWVSGGEEKIEECVLVWAAIAQTLT